MPERYAIFYAPAADSALWLRAAQWLGRDATGAEVTAADIAGIGPGRRMEVTTSARRYGFHATIKPPIVLSGGRDVQGLQSALAEFAASAAPVSIGQLVVRPIEGFLAIVPQVQSSELSDFAQHVVETFDAFRAPPSAAERERRLRSNLTPRQIELMDRFGYPYVMEQFRFHMTIADRLDDAERAVVQTAADAWFAPVLSEPVVLDRLALYHEPDVGAAFVRLDDYMLEGKD